MKPITIPLILLLLSGLAGPIHFFSVSSPVIQQQVQSAQSPSGLRLESVVDLVHSGISDDVIIAKIRQNGIPFLLSADQILQLKKAGVSDRIIRVLIDPAMDERDSEYRPVPVASQSRAAEPAPVPPKTESARTRPAHPDPTRGSRDVKDVVDYRLDDVQNAARDAMVFYGCQIKKERQGFLEGTRPREFDMWSGSGGEKVTVRLMALGDRTEVTVETGKGFVGRLVKRNWSTPIFTEMLRILQVGRR